MSAPDVHSNLPANRQGSHAAKRGRRVRSIPLDADDHRLPAGSEWFSLVRRTGKACLAGLGVLGPVISLKRRLLPHLTTPPPAPVRDQVLPGVKIVRTIEEADAMLRRVDEAFAVSDDEARRVFQQHHMVTDLPFPLDPFSDEYRQAVLDMYLWLHGRPYAPSNEGTPFDVDQALKVPFPYLTRSTATVGQHLIVLGNAIRSMELPERATVLEFGPGWGNIADALSRMGHDVTVIDVEPNFLELISRRSAMADTAVTTILGDFGAVDVLDDQFDAVLFFECFHHCLDHAALLQRLDRVVKPGGRISTSLRSRSTTPTRSRGVFVSTESPCGRSAGTAGSSWAFKRATSWKRSAVQGGRARASRTTSSPGPRSMLPRESRNHWHDTHLTRQTRGTALANLPVSTCSDGCLGVSEVDAPKLHLDDDVAGALPLRRRPCSRHQQAEQSAPVKAQVPARGLVRDSVRRCAERGHQAGRPYGSDRQAGRGR